MAGCSHIYWDESSVLTEKYMAIGALTMAGEDARELADAIAALKRRTIMHKREFKWGEICRISYPIYLSLCDLAFDLIDAKQLAFSCLVLEKSRIDFDGLHNGNQQLAWDRFAHTLMVWKSVPCVPEGNRIVVFPDDKGSNVPSDDARNALNASIFTRYGYPRNYVQSVDPTVSHKTLMGQLNDVLLGSIMYHWNSWHLEEKPKKVKVDLANHIARRAGIRHLASETKFGRLRYCIWKLDFDKAHKKSPPTPMKPKATTPDEIG